jgi:hypothetical protein
MTRRPKLKLTCLFTTVALVALPAAGALARPNIEQMPPSTAKTVSWSPRGQFLRPAHTATTTVGTLRELVARSI